MSKDAEDVFLMILFLLLVLGAITVRRCGYETGLDEGKWRERCRSYVCEDTKVESKWDRANACTCTRTTPAKRK